jgi:hypothetical protein
MKMMAATIIERFMAPSFRMMIPSAAFRPQLADPPKVIGAIRIFSSGRETRCESERGKCDYF